MFDAESYRKQSLAGWSTIAPGWERRREWLREMTAPVSERLVELAAPRPGERFLELAAGTGDLSVAIARRVGEDGSVLCTDFAPEMVEAARRNAEASGADNVDCRVLDAERMQLGDGAVDGAACRFGFMLMADPSAALRESRRVLREGGRLVLSVWRAPDRNPWAAVPALTLSERGHVERPQPGSPGMFALSDPARVEQLVTGAGFAAAEIEEIAFEYRYADADDFWNSIVSLAGGLARAIGSLPDDERAATRSAVLDNFAAFRRADGSYAAPAAAWGVSAR